MVENQFWPTSICRQFFSVPKVCQDGLDKGHIVSGHCPVYGGLITQFGDLGEERNLIAYFMGVLDRREELEEEDRLRQS